MFRIMNNLKPLSLTVEAFQPNPVNLQIMRWNRKPIWLPTAKTKVFKVRPRLKAPLEEQEEMKRLYNNYRTELKSIRSYLTEKYLTENREEFDAEQHRKALEEDFERCNAINELWNRRVKISREQRVQKEFEERIILVKQHLEESNKIRAQRLDEAEELVRHEKEASKTFITPDKLDATIEYAINNPVDYNFALELDGSKIRGRETLPPEQHTSVKINVKQ